ncbi:MAG: cytochrome-c peroxidase [Planctomycetes bacterium]|nr:cytochrome-c peroxidase [Planctomycetota bacterium]
MTTIRLLTLAAPFVAVGLIATDGTSQQGADRSGAPHGATAFAAQQQLVDRLGTTTPGSVPAGVDAGFWRVFAYEPDTADQVALGRKLFFDPRLSRDGTVSCATCHDVARSFTDLRPVSEGIDGQLGRRNAPTVMNAAMIEPLFWDGRSPTLAHQAGQPVLNPIEMGMSDRDAVVAKLAGTEYAGEFERAFGRAVHYDDIQNALAAFQRTLIFLDAPFDRWRAGDESAIGDDAKLGFELFHGKARCAACHPINATNPLGTDYRFHNIGVSAHDKDFEGLAEKALRALDADASEQQLDRLALSTDMSELGRFMVTRNYADVGSFRTPQLRNIGITAPYMHDGSMQTLWDTIDHYNKGGEVNSWLDGGIEALALTEPEIDQLVAFLFTLTDVRFADQNAAAMAKQQQHKAANRPFRDDARASRSTLVFEDRVPTGGK